MAEQLSFDLPVRRALGREDFFVSPANALAVTLIDTPQTWIAPKLVLYGPQGSGKTHLAHVWATAMDGKVVAAADLPNADLPALIQTPLAIEDVPDIRSNDAAQTALFHLHNMTQAERQPLLLTGRAEPGQWDLPLPDLQSRMAGTQAVALSPPDDALLTAVLAKLFADRQIVPRRDVIPYLIAHMDRSFEMAARIVTALDLAALRESRSLSRPLAAQELARMMDQP
ncbi:MAG: DnaA/Hda family protein [Paracoccaceae bacterium]